MSTCMPEYFKDFSEDFNGKFKSDVLDTRDLKYRLCEVAIFEITEKQYKKHKAYFHGWGSDTVEYDTGGGTFTTAIVELEDGSVHLIYPREFRFIDEFITDKTIENGENKCKCGEQENEHGCGDECKCKPLS